MKQTNNAIKFLMAQYRAIFKNANIAMVAAMAAAALAAGQAQAAAHNEWTALTGNITIKDGGDTMAITGEGDKENANPFTVTVQSGGAVTIKGAGAGAGNFVAGNASIVLDAKAEGQSSATADNAKLTIGGNTAASDVANVTVGSVVNKVGTIIISGSGAKATSSLSAGSITLGDDNNSGADLAKVTVAAHGKLNVSGEGLFIKKGANLTVAENGAVSGSTITITDGTVTNQGSLTAGTLTLGGGTLTATKAVTATDLTVSKGTLTATETVTASNELNIAGGKVDATKAVSGKTIKVTAGEVAFAAGGNAALGNASTELVTISGGTIDAKDGVGTIKGKSIKFEKGDIKASKKELTIDGGFEATGGTITIGDSQTLTFKGNASIADEVTVTLDGSTAHNVKVVGTDAENGGKLSVSSKKFAELTGGKGTNKVALSGARSSTAELHFTDEAAINLETAGILTTAGALGTKIDISGNAGTVMVSANEASFAQKDLTAGITIAAKKLTVGTKADGLTISGAGAGLEVGNVLTIGEGTQELKITEGSVSLKADAGVSGSEVKASKITVGSTKDSKKGTLTVSAGEWKIGSLVIDSGTASVINDAVLKITGELTTKDAKNQLVAQDTATIDASAATQLSLKASGTDLQNASTLILDKKAVFDASGNVISANYADGAVTGSANSTINIMDGDKLATISREKFEAFTKKAAFKGLWGVKVDGLVPENTTEMNIGGADNNLIAGVGTGYENVQAKVDGTTPIDNNYSAGSVELSTGDNLTIGTGSMSLQNANAHDKDGMFVSKPGATNEDPAQLAGVNFGTGSTADSSLTLQGSGKIGAITADAAGSGSVTFGAGAGKTGNVDVEGKIGAAGAELAMLVNNGSTVSVKGGDVFAHEIDLNGGSFTVAADKKLVLGDGQAFADSGEGLASTIDGNLKAGELTFKASTTGSVDIAGNAVVDLGTLRGITGIEINVVMIPIR